MAYCPRTCSISLRSVIEPSLAISLVPAFRAAVNVFHETEHDGGPNDRARFRARMIERVLTQFQAIPKGDLDYLLEKLDYYSEIAAAEEALAAGDAA